MNKRLFILLVILMSLSLVGIIFVQVFWIQSSVTDREEQFSRSVGDILSEVSRKITQRETKNYFDRYLKNKDSIGELKDSHLTSIFFIDQDVNSNELNIYSHEILEEDYGIASTFFDNGSIEDTTTIK
ncbi:MAG: two-component sensor histidine kinase, partial [Bacteroidota bacterium]